MTDFETKLLQIEKEKVEYLKEISKQLNTLNNYLDTMNYNIRYI